jgi:hypothetical protein
LSFCCSRRERAAGGLYYYVSCSHIACCNRARDKAHPVPIRI